MIYLIRSASWNEEANSFEFILKIGYTKDSSAKNRFTSYSNHNPTSKVLYKIPNATRRQEGSVHKYFEEFRKYGNEWYEYREEIIEFFKTHTTIESLNFLPEYKFRQERVSEKTDKINKFYKFVNSLKTSKLKSLLLNYLNLKRAYDKLIFLYKLSKNGQLSEEILEKLPDKNFKEYFTILGADRIKALAYNTSLLNKELSILTFDDTILLERIYNIFIPGNRYSLVDIKQVLLNIYQDVGYKKTPVATDLQEWFNIKSVQINTKISKGKYKRDQGFEILSRRNDK